MSSSPISSVVVIAVIVFFVVVVVVVCIIRNCICPLPSLFVETHPLHSFVSLYVCLYDDAEDRHKSWKRRYFSFSEDKILYRKGPGKEIVGDIPRDLISGVRYLDEDVQGGPKQFKKNGFSVRSSSSSSPSILRFF